MTEKEIGYIPLPESTLRAIKVFQDSPTPRSAEAADTKTYLITNLIAHRDLMLGAARAFSEPLHGIQQGAASAMKARVVRYQATAKMIDEKLASLGHHPEYPAGAGTSA